MTPHTSVGELTPCVYFPQVIPFSSGWVCVDPLYGQHCWCFAAGVEFARLRSGQFVIQWRRNLWESKRPAILSVARVFVSVSMLAPHVTFAYTCLRSHSACTLCSEQRILFLTILHLFQLPSKCRRCITYVLLEEVNCWKVCTHTANANSAQLTNEMWDIYLEDRYIF